MRDLHVSIGRKDAVHREPANVGKSLATNWASRLVLGPFHDADEAKVVATAIDFPCDRNPSLRVANPATNALFLVLILLCLESHSLQWRTRRRRRRPHPRRISQLQARPLLLPIPNTHSSEPCNEEDDKLHAPKHCCSGPTHLCLVYDWAKGPISRMHERPERKFSEKKNMDHILFLLIQSINCKYSLSSINKFVAKYFFIYFKNIPSFLSLSSL